MSTNNRIQNINETMTRLAADTIYPGGHAPVKVTTPDQTQKNGARVICGAFEAVVIEETVKAMEQYNSEHPDNRLQFDLVIGTSTAALNTCGLLLRSLYRKGLFSQPGRRSASEIYLVQRPQ